MHVRIRGLDGLRAIAIVWVMLFHTWVVGGLGAWNAVATPGWMGVDLFFALSGYLIGQQVFASLAAGRGVSYADFYTRRAFRILPAFLVVLAVYFAFPQLREFRHLPSPWLFLTFTHNLAVDYQHDRAFSHAWSLCVEEHFYLLFPVIAFLMARRAGLRSVAAITAIALAILFGGVLLRAAIWVNALAPLKSGGGAPGFDTRWVEWIYYPTWCRLDGLLFGVLLAAIRTWRPAWWQAIERRNGVVALVGLAVVALSVVACDERSSLLASVLGFPMVSLGMALLVAAAAAPHGWISRLTPPGAGWLAAASYSLYLVHKAVFATTDGLLPPDMPGYARFAAIAAATIAIGALLHYAVERPGLRLRTRILARRRRGGMDAAVGIA